MRRLGSRLSLSLWVLCICSLAAAQVPKNPGEAACQRGLELIAEAKKRPSESDALRAQALKYLRVGAELGSGTAMFYYALELGSPEPAVGRDLAGAAFWYERAASNGIPQAAYNRALMLLNSSPGEPEKPELAAPWLENAATNGMAAAQKLLGRLYETGQGRPQSSSTAAAYYRAAALQGEPEAQFAWARLMRGGLAPRDPGVDPESLIRTAAEKDVPEAQESLAEAASNRGTLEADAEATRWFLAAAEGGLPLSQWKLGLRLRQGLGIPVDATEGAAWMVIAADGMNRDAIQELRDLEHHVPTDAWALVQHRVMELRGRIAIRQSSSRSPTLPPKPPGARSVLPASVQSPTGRRPTAVLDAKSAQNVSAAAGTPATDITHELPEEYRKAVTKSIWENFVRLHRAEARNHLADPEFDRGRATLTYRLHADGTLTHLEFSPGATEGLFQVLLSEAIEASSPFPKWTPKIRGLVGADHLDLVQTFKWDPEGDR